jgi:hypothetical protein
VLGRNDSTGIHLSTELVETEQAPQIVNHSDAIVWSGRLHCCTAAPLHQRRLEGVLPAEDHHAEPVSVLRTPALYSVLQSLEVKMYPWQRNAWLLLVLVEGFSSRTAGPHHHRLLSGFPPANSFLQDEMMWRETAIHHHNGSRQIQLVGKGVVTA